MQSQLYFFTKSVRFGRTELSICCTGGESRDLAFEHDFRACLKNKSWMFHTCGGSTDEKKTEKIDEIGQMLVPGALNDTETVRKADADMFAKFGLGKP